MDVSRDAQYAAEPLCVPLPARQSWSYAASRALSSTLQEQTLPIHHQQVCQDGSHKAEQSQAIHAQRLPTLPTGENQHERRHAL